MRLPRLRAEALQRAGTSLSVLASTLFQVFMNCYSFFKLWHHDAFSVPKSENLSSLGHVTQTRSRHHLLPGGGILLAKDFLNSGGISINGQCSKGGFHGSLSTAEKGIRPHFSNNLSNVQTAGFKKDVPIFHNHLGPDPGSLSR